MILTHMSKSRKIAKESKVSLQDLDSENYIFGYIMAEGIKEALSSLNRAKIVAISSNQQGLEMLSKGN